MASLTARSTEAFLMPTISRSRTRRILSANSSSQPLALTSRAPDTHCDVSFTRSSVSAATERRSWPKRLPKCDWTGMMASSSMKPKRKLRPSSLMPSPSTTTASSGAAQK